MIVYHGSNHLFSKLSIYNRKKVNERVQAQGPGIYFSTKYDEASHHGCYIYELDIPDDIFHAYSADVLIDYFNVACDYIQHLTDVDLRLCIPILYNNYDLEISGLSEYLCGKMQMYAAFRFYGDRHHFGMNDFMERIVLECIHTIDKFSIKQEKQMLKAARMFDKWSPKVYLFKYDIGVIKDIDTTVIRNIHFPNHERVFDHCQLDIHRLLSYH